MDFKKILMNWISIPANVHAMYKIVISISIIISIQRESLEQLVKM